MKCYSCGNPAVIFRKYEGRAWCKNHFSRQLEARVKKTIRNSKLINKNDKICVALSGGKDSSLTLYLLNKFFEKRPDIEVFALGIDEGIKGYRNESLKIAKKFCKELDVNFYTASFKEDFGKTLDQILKGKKTGSCTYCGVFRRFLLNKKSRELGATKLATGHNLDDEIQSIFINNLKGDINRLLRLGAKPTIIFHPKFTTRIKPLRDIPEKEAGLYTMLNEMDIHNDECPYVAGGIRFEVRDFLNNMEEKYPGIKHNIVRHFDTVLPALRKEFVEKGKVKTCRKCDELTSREVCKACELLESIN